MVFFMTAGLLASARAGASSRRRIRAGSDAPLAPQAEIEHASRLRDPTTCRLEVSFSGSSPMSFGDTQTGVSSTAFEILGVSGLRSRLKPFSESRVPAPRSGGGSAWPPWDSFYCHGFLTPQNIFIAEGQRVLVRAALPEASAVSSSSSPTTPVTGLPARIARRRPASPTSSLGTIPGSEAAAGVPVDGPADEESVMSLDSVEELKG